MSNKTAVISGASGDIGISLAHAFYNENYNLVLLYNKNKKPIDDFIDTHKYRDLEVIALKADLSDENEVDNAVKEIKDNFKNIDVLINNAGISLIKFFDETGLEEWDRIFNVNVKSAFMLSKAFIPNMINRKKGNIINISSMWGISGASMEVAYSASKAALIGMSKALSKEVGPSNINVNVIAPGVIDTKMNNNLSDEDLEVLSEETPMGRIGKPEDVANMAVFLASDKATFITGQVISVDGGFIL